MRRLPIILLLVTAAGCSGLRLSYPLRQTDSSITTFAGNAARNNDFPTTPPPPLFPEWEQDVTAGIGDGAPLLVDSTLIMGNLRGELYAFSVTSGKRFGWVTLGGAIHGSPLVAGHLIIVPLSGSRESVVAYDYVEGKVRWRANGGDIQGSPLLLGERLYAGNTAGRLSCLDPGSGEKLWHFDLPRNTSLKGIRSSPAGTDSTVVFGADDGCLYAVDARTGVLQWRTPVGGAIQATPVLYQGIVYVGSIDGRFAAVDLLSGEVRWTSMAGAAIHGAAVVDSLRVVVGNTGGRILAMDRKTGETVWNLDLRSPVSAGLLGAGAHIYAGTLKREFLAIDRATGSVVWRTVTSGRIKTTPIGGMGRVFIAQDDRLVRSFTEAR